MSITEFIGGYHVGHLQEGTGRANSDPSTAGKFPGILMLKRGHRPSCTGLFSLREKSN